MASGKLATGPIADRGERQTLQSPFTFNMELDSMSQATRTVQICPDSSRPTEIDATLAYLAKKDVAFERDNIAWHSGTLALDAEFPGFFDEIGTISARRIMARPKIVWC